MAVMVRSLCPPSRSNSGDIFRPSPLSPAKFSDKIRNPVKLEVKDLLQVKTLKLALEIKKLLESEVVLNHRIRGKTYLLPSKYTSKGITASSDTDHVVSSRNYLCSESRDFHTRKFRGNRSIEIKLPGYKIVIVEKLFKHQIMEFFSFLRVLFVTNAMMLILPGQSLAETCEPDMFSIVNMPIILGIALIGATVGGLLARQRRGELKRLNDQLRQINAALRRQAKIESYAPNLSYAPVGRIPEKEIIIDSRKEQLISNLKMGKNFLRNQEPEKAFTEFKQALELAGNLGDPIEEKKAARGLGASLQRQGKYRDAIKYHSMVLAISEHVGEDSGNTEAYGAIADCYTELGDLERAGKFYDKYISRQIVSFFVSCKCTHFAVLYE